MPPGIYEGSHLHLESAAIDAPKASQPDMVEHLSHCPGLILHIGEQELLVQGVQLVTCLSHVFARVSSLPTDDDAQEELVVSLAELANALSVSAVVGIIEEASRLRHTSKLGLL